MAARWQLGDHLEVMTNIDNAVHDDGGDEAGDDVVEYKMNTNEVYHKVSVCLLHKLQQVAKDMLTVETSLLLHLHLRRDQL